MGTLTLVILKGKKETLEFARVAFGPSALNSAILVVAVPVDNAGTVSLYIDLIAKNRIEFDLVEDRRIWLG
ncbi:hypothetical protein VNO78_14195 [Psophocarpus tetragonolobus]|uniref:Uncharacterized protein n=1 Tax=Psophocarpus tetragonolobus TaxID=3891 RepID=A0AAN9SPZ6_PSOTE